MLESLLICDSAGLSLYARTFNSQAKIQDPSVLSGLISAIDSIGRTLFSKKVAVITYGEDSISTLDETVSKIVIISKDLFSKDKHINFVFFASGECSLKTLREVATTIYIEIKALLRAEPPDYKKIQESADKIMENNFRRLVSCKGW